MGWFFSLILLLCGGAYCCGGGDRDEGDQHVAFVDADHGGAQPAQPAVAYAVPANASYQATTSTSNPF